jgi:hypothetical protein
MNGAKGILWTLGLVFFVTVATAIINAGGDLFSISAVTWKTILSAGIAAVLAFAINAVSPWITRYGITLKKSISS